MMYYYCKNGTYYAQDAEITDPSFVPITQDAYQTAVAALQQQAAEEAAEAAAEEKSKDEKIAALEQENAELLFQLLTGENYESI